MRMVRLVLVASSAMSQFALIHVTLLEGEQRGSVAARSRARTAEEELVRRTMTYNNTLLLAQLLLLLEAARPFLKPGRRYSVGSERYSFARIECATWPAPTPARRFRSRIRWWAP